MRVRGAAARPSARTASRKFWPKNGPRRDARRRSSDCSIRSMVCVRAPLVEAYLRDMADTDRSLGRQIPNCWN